MPRPSTPYWLNGVGPPFLYPGLNDRETAILDYIDEKTGNTPFGNNVVYGTLQTVTSNVKMVVKVTATNDGQIPYVEMYLDGGGAGSGSQVLKAVVYSDTSNNPDALLATSNEQTVTATAAGTWVQFTFSSPPSVTNGQSIWVGWHGGTTGGVARYALSSGAGLRYNSDTYSDGATTPFGTPAGSFGQTLSIRGVVSDATASQITALQASIANHETRIVSLESDTGGTTTTTGSGFTYETIANFPLPANAVVESSPQVATGAVIVNAAGDQSIASSSILDTIDGSTWRTRALGGSGTASTAVGVTTRTMKVQVVNGGTAQGTDFDVQMATA